MRKRRIIKKSSRSSKSIRSDHLRSSVDGVDAMTRLLDGGITHILLFLMIMFDDCKQFFRDPSRNNKYT